MNARRQLARVERLRQVIVRAYFQPHDAIDVLAAGGQQNDGHGGSPPKLAKNLEAVLLGQHHIQNHELVPAARRKIDRPRTQRWACTSNPSPPSSSPTSSHSSPVVVDDEDLSRHARVKLSPKKGGAAVKNGKAHVKNA